MPNIFIIFIIIIAFLGSYLPFPFDIIMLGIILSYITINELVSTNKIVKMTQIEKIILLIPLLIIELFVDNLGNPTIVFIEFIWSFLLFLATLKTLLPFDTTKSFWHKVIWRTYDVAFVVVCGYIVKLILDRSIIV